MGFRKIAKQFHLKSLSFNKHFTAHGRQSINYFNSKIRSSTHASAKIVQFLMGKDKIIFRA